MDDPLPSTAVAHGGVYVWKDGREHADTIECVMEYPKGFILKYATRLGNNNPVPEAIFFGTKGTFDTESWTARGTGGGKDALTQTVTVPKPAALVPAAPTNGGGDTPAQLDARVGGEGHVRNWLECVRSRKTRNAPIEVGYAHTVASIMCFKAWESGRRHSVWADGRGLDLNMDHHGRGNYGTLWTRLDLGAGTRPFASGGTAPLRMPHSGARTVYWNITAARDIALPPSDFGPLLSFVAMRGSAGRPAADWFVEPMAASNPCQENLQAAMLSRRRR